MDTDLSDYRSYEVDARKWEISLHRRVNFGRDTGSFALGKGRASRWGNWIFNSFASSRPNY